MNNAFFFCKQAQAQAMVQAAAQAQAVVAAAKNRGGGLQPMTAAQISALSQIQAQAMWVLLFISC
jgi:hypothetical protein